MTPHSNLGHARCLTVVNSDLLVFQCLLDPRSPYDTNAINVVWHYPYLFGGSGLKFGQGTRGVHAKRNPSNSPTFRRALDPRTASLAWRYVHLPLAQLVHAKRFMVLLLSEVWFLEALQPHSFISVSAYNFSADQSAT